MTIMTLNQVLQAFKIKASCISASQHRHFSFYDLVLEPGAKISKLNQCSKEIALALKSRSVPIVKMMPELGIVRLQLIHKQADLLPFDQLYRSSVKENGFLPFLLGETDEGNQLWVDMSKNPHLLVAGATGSGKSVFLHNMIANAAKYDDVKLYLVDTKKVEFGPYERPEFSDLIVNVAKDYTSAINLLDNLLKIMEMRYSHFDSIGCANIEQIPSGMNKIVVIIDEVADLMLMDKGGQFQNSLVKLAAKSRAAGIYIILATQRPSVDVLTGLIKANFPARLACKVSSRVDSQIILDYQGAEHLAGRGDAIFKSPSNESVRLQIAHVNPQETLDAVVARLD
ncbi:MAG TPA: DNA translocase FtsK [Anaerovoracaceae bacterium]|nr:DNA translocase FtsK [Anaerovoracaceae bacterium]